MQPQSDLNGPRMGRLRPYGVLWSRMLTEGFVPLSYICIVRLRGFPQDIKFMPQWEANLLPYAYINSQLYPENIVIILPLSLPLGEGGTEWAANGPQAAL